MVTPRRIQNELRTERMHKFLAQFNEQESRRAHWLASRATKNTAPMRTVHGWVSGTEVIRTGRMQCAQDPNAAKETVRHVFKSLDHLAVATRR